MNAFFLAVEIFLYVFGIYVLLKKQDLGIVYIPVLIFSNNIINPTFSASLYYGIISLILLNSIIRNGSFFKYNIFALLLVIYYLILMPRSTDLVIIRPNLFAVFWLFISVPLIAAVYKKYPDNKVLKEATNSAFIILVLFIINVLVSSVFKYAPAAMYGITKGILYGNMYGAGFNILATAIFVTTMKVLDQRRPLDFLVLMISLVFALLSMRRSVIMIGSLGAILCMLTLLTKKDAKKFIVFGCLIFAIGYTVYTYTSFMDMFKERYELRKLDERDIEEEKRFFEYELIYKDMFVYEDYSPVYGYELFNSAGHYGKGVFELRTLHADIPNMAHSSGLLGVVLYLLMVATAFYRSFRSSTSTLDRFILFYCAIAFATFTFTGRYTETASMILLFLTLQLPMAKSSRNAYSDMYTDEEGNLVYRELSHA